MLHQIILMVAVILALVAGMAKLVLLPDDVALLVHFGFTDQRLQVFGALQLIGGLMMVSLQTRLVGAITVSMTVFIEVFLHYMLGQPTEAIRPLLYLLLLALVMKRIRP